MAAGVSRLRLTERKRKSIACWSGATLARTVRSQKWRLTPHWPMPSTARRAMGSGAKSGSSLSASVMDRGSAAVMTGKDTRTMATQGFGPDFSLDPVRAPIRTGAVRGPLSWCPWAVMARRKLEAQERHGFATAANVTGAHVTTNSCRWLVRNPEPVSFSLGFPATLGTHAISGARHSIKNIQIPLKRGESPPGS